MSRGVERFFFLSYCLMCCWPGYNANANRDFHLQMGWSSLEFNTNSVDPTSQSYFDQEYTPGASVPIDVDYDYKRGRTFITNPRFDEGRPVVLGTVDTNNLIVPYPNYTWHLNPRGGCDGMISVFRVAIDECDRLWVMDAGKIGETEVCPPKLLAFDLADDRLIFKHIVEDNSKETDTLFITPVVDVRSREPGDCEDTFVYVADVSGYAVLVVDVRQNRSWRLKHRLFYPHPIYGEYTIEGETFQLMDGVFGMALSPYKQGHDRFMFFHSLASVTENVVSANALRNESYRMTNKRDLTTLPIHSFKKGRPNQAAAEAIDRDGIMYFGIMDPPSIWCWNIASEFGQKNFHQVAIDREGLQFASGVKVITDQQGNQELLVLTSSFQKVMTGSITNDRMNFRVYRGAISKLVSGPASACKNSRPLRG